MSTTSSPQGEITRECFRGVCPPVIDRTDRRIQLISALTYYEVDEIMNHLLKKCECRLKNESVQWDIQSVGSDISQLTDCFCLASREPAYSTLYWLIKSRIYFNISG